MKLFIALALLALAAGAVADERRVLFDRSTNVPPTWSSVQRALPADRIKFIVALTQQNLDVLESTFWRVSDPASMDYQNFLKPSEILDIVRPLPEHTAAVRSWLHDAGVKHSMIHDMGDALEVTTTVAVAETLFQATFSRFEHVQTGQRVVKANSVVSIPSSVCMAVHLVAGLSEFPVPRRKLHRSAGGVDTATIVPATLNNVYKTPTTAVSGNHSHGVIEFEQQYFSNDDLTSFGQQVGVNVPKVPADHIIGTNDPTQPGDEAELDIQWIAALGLGGQSWFWIEGGTTWLYGFATHFFSTASVPDVISISYGWAEFDQCEDGIGAQECQQLGVDSNGYVARVNVEFQKIGLRGVSILVASGDSGANGRTDGGCTDPILHPDFPAASPYVTSVGATQLMDEQTSLPNPPPACQASSGFTCASSGTENAVSYDVASFASGGGFSNVAPMPQYQAEAVAAYKKSGVAFPPSDMFNHTGRGYPDVAALGNAILIYEGGLETVGGTSCSSPIWGGVVSLLNGHSIAKNGKPLGFLNPLLYSMYAAQPDTFIDITVGDNKCTEDGCASTCQGFTCAKGWDAVTGLGSPNYPNILSYIQTNYAANQKPVQE